jgi:hypothetical protein
MLVTWHPCHNCQGGRLDFVQVRIGRLLRVPSAMLGALQPDMLQCQGHRVAHGQHAMQRARLERNEGGGRQYVQQIVAEHSEWYVYWVGF